MSNSYIANTKTSFMKSIILFVISMVVSSAFLNAQIEFLPGHIVLSTGDTIKGDVGYKEWMYNPETIEFKTEGKEIVYNITKLKSFTVDGRDTYRRFNVSYYLSPSELSDAKKEFGDKKETKVVWLRLIYQGVTDLYELNTKQRMYFFIKGDEGFANELVYRVRLYNNNLYKDESYKMVLSPFAKDNPRATELLQQIDYGKRDLLSFFNSLQQQEVAVVEKQKKRVKRDITGSVFVFPIVTEYTKSHPNSIGLSVGSGITFSSARGFGKYQCRVGANINYLAAKYIYMRNSPFEKNIQAGCVSLEPVIKGSYVIGPLGLIRSAIGAEVGYNFQVGGNWKDVGLWDRVGYAKFSLSYSVVGSFGQIGVAGSICSLFAATLEKSPPPVIVGLSYGYLF